MSYLCQRNHRHHCNDHSLSINHPPFALLVCLFPSTAQWPPLSLSVSGWKLSSPVSPTILLRPGHWFWTGMIRSGDDQDSTHSPLVLPSRCQEPRARFLHLCGSSQLCCCEQNTNKTPKKNRDSVRALHHILEPTSRLYYYRAYRHRM